LEVSGQLNTPAALHPEKQSPLTIGYGTRWTPETILDDVERRKILTLPELEL
jgi:hypothetical protein